MDIAGRSSILITSGRLRVNKISMTSAPFYQVCYLSRYQNSNNNEL